VWQFAAVADQEYIGRLQSVIRQVHGCDSAHLRTVAVDENYRGQTIWKGDVEVFAVNHPQAKMCYAWSFKDEQMEERGVAVLRTTSIKSPADAVKGFVAARSRAR